MLIEQIKMLLYKSLDISHLDIVDDSKKHKNHPQSNGGHFNLTIISSNFESKSLIERHRMIYKILDCMIKKEIHALSINAKAPNE
tara:strand:- start:395 stop:649 length:255 start_codon:yes stop_codon:yes gene_type:complete